MRVIHRLVCYDPATDRPKMRFDIPGPALPQAKEIARVPDDDPGAVWSYPLAKPQAHRLGRLIGAPIDGGEGEFFLEAFAEPGVGNRSG